MHSLLENYLAEVRAKLGALPMKRREEEMREMRQHLVNSTAVNQELGQGEEEAAANALAEFGTPERASESVLWAWRRDVRKENVKYSWDFMYFITVPNGYILFDDFREHTPCYEPYCIIFCGWALTLLVTFSRFLPTKYQPSWMRGWFVLSVQQDANRT